MNTLSPGEKVLLTGTFLYAGTIECDLRIVFSAVCYGSGDHEDTADIGEDVEVDTYYVQFGSTAQRGVFSAGGAGYASLAKAQSAVEAMPGIGITVEWHACVA